MPTMVIPTGTLRESPPTERWLGASSEVAGCRFPAPRQPRTLLTRNPTHHGLLMWAVPRPLRADVGGRRVSEGPAESLAYAAGKVINGPVSEGGPATRTPRTP